MIGFRALGPLLDALGLLTVLPVGRRPLAAPAGATTLFFPLVGGMIGGLLMGLDWLLGHVLPEAPRAALVVVAWAIATGGLHLDGLADTADGLMAAGDRRRRLEAMADPRVGAFGALAVAGLLLLKWSALSPLPGRLRMGALALAPALSRAAALLPMAIHPPCPLCRDGRRSHAPCGARLRPLGQRWGSGHSPCPFLPSRPLSGRISCSCSAGGGLPGLQAPGGSDGRRARGSHRARGSGRIAPMRLLRR